jgi:hypothetical protein
MLWSCRHVVCRQNGSYAISCSWWFILNEQSGIKTVNAPVQLCKYILKKNQQINWKMLKASNLCFKLSLVSTLTRSGVI